MQLNIISEINQAEEQLRLAMISSDIEALNLLISDDLVFTNHLGLVLTKSDDLAAHQSGDVVINSLQLSDQIIRFAGDAIVISTHAKIEGSYKGEASGGDFRFTRVWQKKTDSWQVIAGHASLSP